MIEMKSQPQEKNIAFMRSAILLVHRFILLFAIFSSVTAFGIPQFASLSGNNCIACHTNAQGGGLRTFRGWKPYSGISLIDPASAGLGPLYTRDPNTNTLFDGRMTVGGDFRFQSARSHKSEESNRRYFPMQASLYSSYRFNDLVVVDGSYNFGPKKFLGQQSWTGSLIIQPRYSHSQFRVGFFRPSIGVRYDDHTMLPFQVAGSDMQTLIPVNYAEYGAEYSFNRYDWLTIATGIFGAESLAENRITDKYGSEISLIKDENDPSYLVRMEFRTRAFLDYLNPGAGVSFLKNNDFTLTNIIGSLGIAERVSILGEYAMSDKGDIRETRNVTLDLTCRIADPFLIFLRGERGKTKSFFTDYDVETHTNQGAVGTVLFLLPYISIRPEYRIVDTERYRSTRYAVQLHIFR